jgi:hypothetical protein
MKAKCQPGFKLTYDYLSQNPNTSFVYGCFEHGYPPPKPGEERLAQHHPHGCVGVQVICGTPDKSVCYQPEAFRGPFFKMLNSLEDLIKGNPQRTFYVARLGSGRANRYKIWETIIRHNLIDTLGEYSNVVFLWDVEQSQ